jgi:arylformamidase
MTIYDVTASLKAGMLTWDGEPGPELRPIKQIGVNGEPAQVSLLTVGTHCGTHVDAPAHFFPGAGGVESLPLDALVGPCRIIEVGGGRLIRPADLWPMAEGAQRVLLKTPSSAFWDEPVFRRDFVALASAAAEWLAAEGVLLVGIDSLSIDPYDADPAIAHRILLDAGVVVLEGLDLRQVLPGEYDLAALPLKLVGADGAPARVVLRSLGGDPSETGQTARSFSPRSSSSSRSSPDSGS